MRPPKTNKPHRGEVIEISEFTEPESHTAEGLYQQTNSNVVKTRRRQGRDYFAALRLVRLGVAFPGASLSLRPWLDYLAPLVLILATRQDDSLSSTRTDTCRS